MNTKSRFLPIAAALLLFSALPARAQEEEELEPLGGVIADMQVAGGRLAKLLTDKPTQQKQKDALDKLNLLIKELELRRQQMQGNGPSGNNPEDPLNDSRITGGPGGSGPLHAAKRNGSAWGQLPAHKRQQILQSMTEGFPAHYQQILERYYRRLSEEKPASDTAEPDAAPPSTAADKTPPANKKTP